MTILARAKAFCQAYAKWPASWPWVVKEQGRDVLYAVWVLGNDYRNKTRYYGAYPPGYLDRVMALFPDITASVEAIAPLAVNGRIPVSACLKQNSPIPLHVFSGSLPASARYLRVDVNPSLAPEILCNVYDLPTVLFPRRHRLLLADPPYSAEDAKRYETPMVDRRRAVAALADVTTPGGHLAWLDTAWPMHSKRQWVTVGRIFIQRSTNHRVRLLSLFERQPESAHTAPEQDLLS